MNMWVDTLMIVVVLINLALLGSSRLQACIRLVAMQGVAVGLLPLLIEPVATRSLMMSAVVITLKGFVVPWLLRRAVREANVRREVEPLVDYTLSIVIGMLALGGALWVGRHIPASVGTLRDTLMAPVALATMSSGLFLVIARRKALTQVLGYVVLENGIYTLGLGLIGGVHLLIELGVLLDVFVAVFVMGIAIYHINREFDHIDSDQLSTLKG